MPASKMVTVYLVLCKSLIYGFLLAANGHLLRQKSSTCTCRASFSSLQLPIGYGAVTRNFNLYKALEQVTTNKMEIFNYDQYV